MRSLRARAMRGAVTWAALSAITGAFALFVVFYAEAQSRFDARLAARHGEVVAALGNSGGDPERMAGFLPDPDYARPFSGRYWQITRPDGTSVSSPSLFNSDLPGGAAAGPELSYWAGQGPDGPIRGAHQRVTLANGSGWVISVAQSLGELRDEQRRIERSLFIAFGIVGATSVLGAFLQFSSVLRPVRRLRDEVAHRWDAGTNLDPAAYPEEVEPLVSDINLLIERNRKVIEGARRQAADLAHALKTPVAILRNEIDARDPGRDDAVLREAVERIDAQILRSLARIRAGNSAAAGYNTPLGASVERLARLFRKAPGSETLELVCEVEPGLTVAMDRQDIEEVLGNLLENALKWRRKAVRLKAETRGAEVVIEIDDDGPGIPEARRAEALRAGGRLDTSAAGTGLGLAIASDLVSAYDGRIGFATAPGLGGLRVTVTVPALRGLPGIRSEPPPGQA